MITKEAARIQEISDTIEVLDAINNPHCNLSIWNREISHEMKSYIDILVQKNFTSQSKKDELNGSLRELLASLPYSSHLGYQEFIQDIQLLYGFMQQLSGNPNPKIHLALIHQTQCPLFHVDFNHLRLICTYKGKGTQWIDEENSDRRHLGCGRNEEVVKDTNLIHQTKQTSVAILKGERFPGNMGYGIIHKSPELEEGESRLFLRIESSASTNL